MNSLKDGDKVRIKKNAFGDSTDPKDVASRGQIGEVESLAYLGTDWVGCWVVWLDNGPAHVTTEEIEQV